jgi:hypothetical protein
MNLLNILSFLLVCKEISCSVKCFEDENFAIIRKRINLHFKGHNKNHNSIYFVADYAILNETLSAKTQPKINTFYSTISLRFPIFMPKYTEIIDFYVLNVYLDNAGYFSDAFHIKEISEPSNSAYSKIVENDKCSDEKVFVKKFLTDSIDSFNIALTACHFEPLKKPGSFNITKNLILFVNQNFTQSEKFDAKNYIHRNFEYPEFDKKGFCLCDDLLIYINDCHDEEKFLLYNLVLIIGIIILLFVVYVIFQKVYKCSLCLRKIKVRDVN